MRYQGRTSQDIGRNKDRRIGREAQHYTNIQTLKYPGKNASSLYFNAWKLNMFKAIRNKYADRHSYLETCMDWSREVISRNQKKYKHVFGDKTGNKMKDFDYQQDYNAASDRNKIIDGERTEIYNFIISKLSEESIDAMRSNKTLWDAASKVENIISWQSPFLLLQLVYRTHMNLEDINENDIWGKRSKLLSDFADFKPVGNESALHFVERLELFKSSVDAFSIDYPIPPFDKPNGNPVPTPIIAGGEYAYAEKVVSTYAVVYNDAAIKYRNDIIAKSRNCFATMREALDYLTSYVTSKPIEVRFVNTIRNPKRDRDDISDEDSERVENLKFNKKKVRDEKKRKSAESKKSLNPCNICVQNFATTYGCNPPANLFVHYYPRDCPIFKKKAADSTTSENKSSAVTPADTPADPTAAASDKKNPFKKRDGPRYTKKPKK